MPSQRRERRLTSELGFRKHLGGKWAGRDVDAPSRTSKSHAHDGEGWVADGSSGGRDKHLRQQQPRSTEIAVSSAEGGFMTARDTARNMYTARGSETDDYLSAVEPYPTKTARDMFTARGFETDDYMSAVDSTPRRKVSFVSKKGRQHCCWRAPCTRPLRHDTDFSGGGECGNQRAQPTFKRHTCIRYLSVT